MKPIHVDEVFICEIEQAQKILSEAKPKVASWGIELVDVRFKRINYNANVADKIFARMASERKQIADRFRSEGAGEAAVIIGRKERELLTIQSEAYRKEQEILGKADAEASRIYAENYSSSEHAAEFYRFMKTLETYRNSLGKESTLILSTKSDLFRLMKQVK